jgi:hypothetical protein
MTFRDIKRRGYLPLVNPFVLEAFTRTSHERLRVTVLPLPVKNIFTTKGWDDLEVTFYASLQTADGLRYAWYQHDNLSDAVLGVTQTYENKYENR